jgi:hypothetical protein
MDLKPIFARAFTIVSVSVKMDLVNLIAKPLGLRTFTTEAQSARRTHREKRKFKVGLTRMLYVGIIDMMIITPFYGWPLWGKRAQRKSRVNFKS